MDKTKSIYKGFTGTIDALLEHCAGMDADKVADMATNKTNDILSPGECRAVIMDEFKCSLKKAEEIRMAIALEEIAKIQSDLKDKGYLELTGYDEDGNAIYIPTELGKKVIGFK